MLVDVDEVISFGKEREGMEKEGNSENTASIKVFRERSVLEEKKRKGS